MGDALRQGYIRQVVALGKGFVPDGGDGNAVQCLRHGQAAHRFRLVTADDFCRSVFPQGIYPCITVEKRLCLAAFRAYPACARIAENITQAIGKQGEIVRVCLNPGVSLDAVFRFRAEALGGGMAAKAGKCQHKSGEFCGFHNIILLFL